MTITPKQFATRFNKLIFANNNLENYVSIFLLGLLELKTLKNEEYIRFPLARMYGALYRIHRDRKVRTAKQEVQYNFYQNLLELEELAVKLLTIVSVLQNGLEQGDEEHLSRLIDRLFVLTQYMAAYQNITLDTLQQTTLEIFKPISLYRGSKEVYRLKFLKKKYVDGQQPSPVEQLIKSIKNEKPGTTINKSGISPKKLKNNLSLERK